MIVKSHLKYWEPAAMSLHTLAFGVASEYLPLTGNQWPAVTQFTRWVASVVLVQQHIPESFWGANSPYLPGKVWKLAGSTLPEGISTSGNNGLLMINAVARGKVKQAKARVNFLLEYPFLSGLLSRHYRKSGWAFPHHSRCPIKTPPQVSLPTQLSLTYGNLALKPIVIALSLYILTSCGSPL